MTLPRNFKELEQSQAACCVRGLSVVYAALNLSQDVLLQEVSLKVLTAAWNSMKPSVNQLLQSTGSMTCLVTRAVCAHIRRHLQVISCQTLQPTALVDTLALSQEQLIADSCNTIQSLDLTC